jgi:glucan phosphoethanolaminetransferase (alkaline phosphatase superfamily)
MILHKVLKYLVLLLSLVAMGFFFYTLVLGDEAIELNTDGSQAVTVSPLMVLAYVTLGLIILLVLVFVVKGLVTNPAAAKKSLISVGLLAVVAAISYFVLADNGVTDMATGKVIELDGGEQLSPGTSQLIGASIYMFYILAVVAIGTVVWAGVTKALKR